MQIPKIDQYIRLYDTEEYLFSVVGNKVREQGYLTFGDFFKICMWKSNRQKQNYLKNKNTVEQVTKEAFKEKDEAEKINIL